MALFAGFSICFPHSEAQSIQESGPMFLTARVANSTLDLKIKHCSFCVLQPQHSYNFADDVKSEVNSVLKAARIITMFVIIYIMIAPKGSNWNSGPMLLIADRFSWDLLLPVLRCCSCGTDVRVKARRVYHFIPRLYPYLSDVCPMITH